MVFMINLQLNIVYLFCVLTFLCNHVGHGFSVSNIFNSVKDSVLFYSISYTMERCDGRWVPQNLESLEKDLEHSVFGQHIALEVVMIALHTHVKKKHRKKPLVLSFHGWTGGGKGYVGNFIVKHFFKQGESSKFLKKYVARINFPLESEVLKYQKQLQKDLEDTISRCPKAVFIFDEVDKYPPKVLDGIKAYLDFSSYVNGHDFREAIFIFITNSGQRQINDITQQKYKDGGHREDLQLRDFENILKTLSFNDEGGFYQSDLISHHMIDYVVPFLPLEREHVELCIRAEMKLRNMSLDHFSDVVNTIMEDLTFGPEDTKLYSVNGCKHVAEKVDFLNEKERRKDRLRHLEL